MIAQALAAKLNEKLFGDNLGGGLLGPALTAVFGGFKAGGGGVDAGKSYVVGEQGPELFTPTTSGSITPNSALGGAGVTVIQHINVGSGVNRNDVMLAMNAAKNAAVAEVGDAARRARSFA
jgi:phage-related minor tail protein